jgi:hypothetical protein
MKDHCLFVLILLSFASCGKNNNAPKDTSALVPESSSLVFKVNALSDFKNLIKDNALFSELVGVNASALSNHLMYLNTNQEVLIAINSDKKKDFFALITKNQSKLISKDSIEMRTTEKSTTPDISQTIYKKDTLFHRIIDGLFFGSNKLELVKKINKNTTDTQFTELLAKSDKKKTISITFKNSTRAGKLLYLTPSKNKPTTGYSLLDFTIQNNSIQYNGITKGKDSLYFINSFKNTTPQELKISKIIPENAAYFKRIAFNDFRVFSKNSSVIKRTTYDSLPNVLSLSTEISEFKINNQNALAIHALDSDMLEQTLISDTSIETYKDIPIYSFQNPDLFTKKLSPFITFKNANYFFIFENFAVFSNTIETLKTVITEKLIDHTLSNSEAFKNLTEDLADDSSYFIYKNNEELSKIFPNTEYNTNAVQFIYDSNFAHANASLKAYKKPAQQHTITEHFSVTLPTEIITDPQAVKSALNNTYDIVVQDANDVLYLISNSGRILWKKQLSGQIIGKIEQIDSYKNGRLQLVFATHTKIYMIDRNGKDVDNFPLNFKDKITQPLSVFDYDQNKNYRLLITQNKSLLMFDTKGKKISGFSYKTAKNTIAKQPKHFKISNKDYIVFAQGETLEILNRQGKTRIPVKANIPFSNNGIYLYQNQFTTTNDLGQLIQVNTKGQLNKKPLGLNKNHSIESTSKTLVSLSENKLNIKNKIIDLDYGDYTTPSIFYLGDKIYISLTDQQAKKIYLFDSQGKLVPNFPIYGISAPELQNLDTNNGLELITKSDPKTLTVYKLN